MQTLQAPLTQAFPTVHSEFEVQAVVPPPETHWPLTVSHVDPAGQGVVEEQGFDLQVPEAV